MGKQLATYKQTEQYETLVEESRAIITEGVFRSRQELIDTYRQLGERICTDDLYKKWEQGSQGKFMRDLAQDIGKSVQTLYYATQFYSKLGEKEFSNALENYGKNISWRKIIELLPGPKTEEIKLPDDKYEVLYLDPPWAYDVDLSNKATRSPENNYPVMNLEELKAMKGEINKIASKDCVMFMWTTAPKLNWVFPILEAWGFDYKTNFIWDKVKPMMGHYSSVRHEILIIAGRGSSVPKCDGKTIQSIDSVQSIDKTSVHSQKPEDFRKIIETLYPNTKKIELFARGKAPKGWVFWGQEVID